MAGAMDETNIPGALLQAMQAGAAAIMTVPQARAVLPPPALGHRF